MHFNLPYEEILHYLISAFIVIDSKEVYTQGAESFLDITQVHLLFTLYLYLFVASKQKQLPKGFYRKRCS